MNGQCPNRGFILYSPEFVVDHGYLLDRKIDFADQQAADLSEAHHHVPSDEEDPELRISVYQSREGLVSCLIDHAPGSARDKLPSLFDGKGAPFFIGRSVILGHALPAHYADVIAILLQVGENR